jgi:hypothetical protein
MKDLSSLKEKQLKIGLRVCRAGDWGTLVLYRRRSLVSDCSWIFKFDNGDVDYITSGKLAAMRKKVYPDWQVLTDGDKPIYVNKLLIGWP